MKLKTVGDEAEDCLQAFKDVEVGSLVMHCHHDTFVETLSGSAVDRIGYIWRFKDKSERALRLRLFRPFPKTTAFAEYPELKNAYAVWNRTRVAVENAHAVWDRVSPVTHAAWDKARAAWDKARLEWYKICERYHAKLCQPGCPWNGITIFEE